MTRLTLVQVSFMQSGLCSQLQRSKVNYTWTPIKKKTKNYNSHGIFHVFTFKQYEEKS